jgi:2-methylcitrate dehydratase PrpD
MTAGQHATADRAPLARRLARAALSVSFADLPAAATSKAKDCLLDFLACALEARSLPWSRQAIGVVRPLEKGASIIGAGIEASPADAAFANAVLGHGLVREDMHAGSICHHGVVIWPTLLALAQRTPVSGATLLAAAIVGYEAGGRIGRALISSDIARLFRPTGLVGPLGAALGAAALLGLDEEAATSALALAANTSAGLNQWPHTGGSEMYFHPGFAARGAMIAVELAELGAYASPAILEGEAGLFAGFRRAPPNGEIALFAGERPEILDVYNKPAPACNFAQTACQAAVRAARRLGGDSARVRSVTVRLPAAALRYPGCDFAGPFERPLQAKMSIQFGVAAALARGTLAEENYARLDDPRTGRLLAAIRLEEDGALTRRFPASQGAEVRVVLDDGSSIAERLDDVIPATPVEIRERFRAAAGAALGSARAAEIEACVDNLERERDAGRVAALAGAGLAVAWPRAERKALAEGLS